MKTRLIRFGVVALALTALVYACSDSGSPSEPNFNLARFAQSECGEDQFLTSLGPVLATWEDSLEAWQDSLDLTTPPAFSGDVGAHLDGLADALTQWETTLNAAIASADLDSVADFVPGTSNHQDYLTGLSGLLESWETKLDTAHGGEFLPAPPVFAADETPPVIECPDDTLITCAGEDTVVIDFAINVTDDCDGEPTVTVDPPGNRFPAGETTVTITASDSTGNESTCSFTVTVEAGEPPVITDLEAEPNVLWPPNHKWVTVRLDPELENPCDLDVDWDIVDVESNESDNGTGDGNTSPDWQIVDDRRLKLRAERSGNGSGREYTITLRAQTDAGEDERTVRVFVPHSRGRKN